MFLAGEEMRLLSKVIKACFVKQGFTSQSSEMVRKVSTPSVSLNNEIISTSECHDEFTKETGKSIYLETKEMLNELIAEAEKRAESIISEAEMQARELMKNTKNECEELKEKACEEGFQNGYQESLKKGETQVEEFKAQTLELITEISTLKQNFLADHFDDILDLIFHISRKMINAAIEFKPELISAIVKKILEETNDEETLTIKVNPVHVPFLDIYGDNFPDVKRNKITVEPDPAIKPGDCIVVTDKGFIDAQIDEQLLYLKQLLKDEYSNVEL